MSSIQIGPNSDRPVEDGLGCMLACVGLAILIWALSGFPGLS